MVPPSDGDGGGSALNTAVKGKCLLGAASTGGGLGTGPPPSSCWGKAEAWGEDGDLSIARDVPAGHSTTTQIPQSLEQEGGGTMALSSRQTKTWPEMGTTAAAEAAQHPSRLFIHKRNFKKDLQCPAAPLPCLFRLIFKHFSV